MTKRYNYRIFPTTWKAWFLLSGAFVAGGLILVGYFAFFLFFSFSDWLDEVDVTYVNQTNQQITVYIDDSVEVTVPPRGSVTESYYELEWWFDRTVTARDSSGRVIVALRIDDDELKDMGYRIVFEDRQLGGSAAGGDCLPIGDESCFDAQTELAPISSDSCVGTERRVCLAPMGEVSPGLVRHLVDHYLDEYRLAITVLTPHAIPEAIFNEERNQIDAPDLIRYTGDLFPGVYNDPDAILMIVTPVDLYNSSQNFRSVFGARRIEDPKAVVSTARMDPAAYGLPPDDELFFSRARKMFSRYIGFFYYGLPPSDDPKEPSVQQHSRPRRP